VSDAWNEDERLAAFLDGRLDERERTEMLAHLDTDDDAYEVFAGLASILRQAEEEDALAAAAAAGAGGVLPDAEAREPVPGGTISLTERIRARADRPERARAGRRVPVLRWVAIAAMCAGAVLVGRALWPRTPPDGDPVRVAARLERVPEGLPAKWTEATPWATVRGNEGGGSPEARIARATRAGALLLDLSVSVQGRDAAETRLLARQIAERFDPRGGPDGALGRIVEGAGSPPDRLQPLVRQATDDIAQRLGRRDALRLGAWVEAALLAAATRDAAFFGDAYTGKVLEDAARITAPDRPARIAVEEVRALLAGAGPPRWDALTRALRVVAGELARA
jgi:hypothetical protein